MRLWPNRKYKSGTEWCLWRWSDVPTGYIVRLHLVKTPWFAVCLHWLLGPDPEPYLHDHPVSFLSIILRGGYAEDRFRIHREWPFHGGTSETLTHVWYNWIRATPDDQHSIMKVNPNTLTLCFMGPKVREWGYHTADGWVHWKEYNKKYKSDGV